MGWLKKRQSGQEEREDTGSDNKLKESVGRTEKRGETKRSRGTKSGMRAAASSLDEPLLTFLVRGHCSGTHTGL